MSERFPSSPSLATRDSDPDVESERDDTPTWSHGLPRPLEEITKRGSLVPVVEEGSSSEVALSEPPPDSLRRQLWSRRWVIAGLGTLSFMSALLLGLWWSASKRAPQDPARVSSATESPPAAPPSAVPPAEAEASLAPPVTKDPASAAPKEEPEERDTAQPEAPATPAGAPRRRMRERPVAPAAPQQLYRPNRI